MQTIYKRKLYIIKALIRNIDEALKGFKCGNYREEILNGNYVEGFNTNKELAFSSLRSEFELMLPTIVEESQWLS